MKSVLSKHGECQLKGASRGAGVMERDPDQSEDHHELCLNIITMCSHEGVSEPLRQHKSDKHDTDLNKPGLDHYRLHSAHYIRRTGALISIARKAIYPLRTFVIS